MQPDWLNYVDEKRRKNLLQILEELSKFQNKENLNFIIIGALALLIRGYLKYKRYWDIDILFKSEKKLKEFIKNPKSKSLKIVDYDDTLMVNKNITSFHTAWAFDRKWFNVDYILRKRFFEFYTHNINTLKPYRESVKMDNGNFQIDLYIAHAWDIIVEKIFSPRTERDIQLKIDASVDIRHIFVVYDREKHNTEFWFSVLKKAKLLGGKKEFKAKLLNILLSAEELGYRGLEITPDSIKILKDL